MGVEVEGVGRGKVWDGGNGESYQVRSWVV
jgi:hypothetical protein